VELILKHVELGSTIHTEGWASYNRLSKIEYNHNVVIHDENIVNHDTWCISKQ
jgi:hypothetical protein